MDSEARTLLNEELTTLTEHIIQLSSMVTDGLDKAMAALRERDVDKARAVIHDDTEINILRYTIENEALRILATQQPMATDLRNVIAAIHIAVELERIGDHAAGIASLVERMRHEDEIDTLHKLPKMAKRAREMLETAVQAYVDRDAEVAEKMMRWDDKLDKQYGKLFRETVKEMRDDDYIRRATFLLWVGHNLERIGDRATNLAERVVFMVTGEFTEVFADFQ